MNITILGKNVIITAPLKEYAEIKIGHLEKFVHPLAAHIELGRDPHHHAGAIFGIRVNLAAGGKVMRAEAHADDAYAAIDLLIPKLHEQISKFTGKKAAVRRRKVRAAKTDRVAA